VNAPPIRIRDRDIFNPGSEAAWHALRAQDVTSTESAAFFGLSPYVTPFELWHRKRDGAIVTIEENDRMKWGRRMEAVIAHGIAHDLGLKIRKLNAYVRHTATRLGASFDFEIVGAVNQDGPGLFEIKKVDELVFRDKWTEDDMPDHIECQVQHQLEVINRDWAIVGVLVGGNRAVTYRRSRNTNVGAALIAEATAFWSSIEQGAAPAADYLQDAEFIAKLYGYAEPDKVVRVDDLPGRARVLELVDAYNGAAALAKEHEEYKQAAKAELLTLIGDAEKVISPGFTISAGVVGEADISYHRNAYRGFRITPRKDKP